MNFTILYGNKWKRNASGAGHGGMDYLEDYRLINALVNGLEPDMDVYDAAMMSAIIEFSEKSIESGSQPMPFPDFTSGMWKQARESTGNEYINETANIWRKASKFQKYYQ